MNKLKEIYVDVLKKENEKYENKIAELTNKVESLERSLEEWQKECAKLDNQVSFLLAYKDGIKDAIRIVKGDKK